MSKNYSRWLDFRGALQVCPKCGKGYDAYPAMSRIDGSDICPACGVREAMEAFTMIKEDKFT